MTSRFVAMLAVLVAVSTAGCAVQSATSRGETAELRRLLIETRRDLEDVRRDQERLRSVVEYLQYAKAPGAQPEPRAGRGVAANNQAPTAWPADPWSRSQAETFGGSAKDFDSVTGAPPGTPQRQAAPEAPAVASQKPSPKPEYGLPLPDRAVGTPPPPSPDPAGIVANVRGSGSWIEPGSTGVEPLAPTVPSSLRGTGFDDGVRALSEEQYDDAIQYFRDFIHGSPTSGYADDAQYWIADSYLRKGLYSNAIKEFNQVVLRYGSSDRSAAALLKLAEVFSKIGDQVDARLSLQKLVKRYPGSSEASQAYRLLEQLGG